MKITQLRYFCNTCKHMSLTQASEELFVSTPAVSNAIKDLEKEFGVSLLIRGNSGNNRIELTTAGKTFYNRAQKLVEYVDSFIVDMNNLSKQTFTVSVGAPQRLANYIIPLLEDSKDFLEKHNPNIQLVVNEIPVYELVQSLNIGKIDCFFGTDKPPEYQNCKKIPFCDLPLYVVCSKTFPLAQKTICNIDDIADYPVIACLGASKATSSNAATYYEQRGKELKYAATYSQFSTLEQMLIRNKGFAISDDTMNLSNDTLVHIPLENAPHNHIFIYYKDTNLLNGEFMNYLKFLTTIPK